MNQKLRALIVDDETLSREKIRSLLEKRSDFEICGESANGLEAYEAIRKQNPDLVFLDIQMPELDGFALIDAIGLDNMPALILVTAYDCYAIQAFEKNALDYLLKPFSEKRFFAALDRAVTQIQNHSNDNHQNGLRGALDDYRMERRFVERLVIKTTRRIFFVKLEEIDWIEAQGNYVAIHVGSDTHLMRETMRNLEDRLNPQKFLRIHRSCIVNVDRIKEMQPNIGNDYVVHLDNGESLVMSRRYREKMNKRIGNYF